MTGKQNRVLTTAADNRLPRPIVTRPISETGFAMLVERWRKSDVWLSLWDREGRNVDCDLDGPRLWTALWSSGEFLCKRLGNLAKEAIEASTDPDVPPERQTGSIRAGSLGHAAVPRHSGSAPWSPDVEFIVVPVQRRAWTIGVVLAGMISSRDPGEGFARLCMQCGVDREMMERFAADVGRVPSDRMDCFRRLLQLSVDQTREVDVEREESAILTSNLENTYEELNLVYQISGRMHLPQKPSEMLERVSREVLEVSRASAIAFVLSEQDSSAGLATNAATIASQELADRVVQAGDGAPGLIELDRLAESLNISAAAGVNHILLNEARDRPELLWAKDWLCHLAALPLWHDQQPLGVLLAINCEDEGDFTSVDVQLLRAVADRVAAFLVNQHLYDDLGDLLMGLLHALVNSIDAKDPYTCGHSERVAFFSRALAEAAGLSAAQCQRVYLAGLLHDVGKIGVPDAILCKPGRLTNEEFDAMKKHPEVGARILSRVRQVADLVPSMLHHHERTDGRGYPEGLTGESIPLIGRIICLADCFDAMTTSRTYRTALPAHAALVEIRRCSGTQFDPNLAESFMTLDHEQLLKSALESFRGDPTIGGAGVTGPMLNGPLDSGQNIPIPQGVSR